MMRRLIIFGFVASILLLPAAGALAQTTDTSTPEPTPDTTEQTAKIIKPVLQVDLPALSFENSVIIGDGNNGCDEGYVCVDTVGTYINAFYKWGASAAVIFAIVLIMVGGVEYMIGSAAGTIERAKGRIKNAIIGLLLIFSTTAILTFVNPNIVSIQPVRAEILDPVAYHVASGDTSEANAVSSGVIPAGTNIPAGSNNQLVLKNNMESIGIYCPRSRDADLQEIFDSFKNKVTYRLGGKGQDYNGPPYSAEIDRKNVRKDDRGVPYGYYCPDGTMCLDCSGFLNIMSECAGIGKRGESGGTAQIFGDSQKIVGCGEGSVTLEDGTDTELTPGDYIGFGGQHTKPDEDGNKPTTANGAEWPGEASPYGHIWMYVNDSQLVNSAGSGRRPGTALKQQSLSYVCGNYPIHLTPVK